MKKKISVMIDSGSTLTYLPKDLYKNFIKQFQQTCKNKKGINMYGKFKKDDSFGLLLLSLC